MNYFMARMHPYIGMMIWDIVVYTLYVISLFLLFGDAEKRWMGLLVPIGAGIIFVFGLIYRYLTIYRRDGIDDVTGGKNKKVFTRIVLGLIKGGDQYVMVYGNIDRFKLVNDMYGTEAGDVILQKIHKIIDDELRWDEASGHLMADNFGILMRYHSIKKLDERLFRINKQIREISDESGMSYGIVMTYGIYVIRDNMVSANSILERANLARANITNAYLVPLGVYDDRAREQLGRERELELKMQRAIENHEFVPFLQPKYELRHETVAGAEALVRWIDPVEGMIFPNEFIPLFEKNGYISKLDLYTFEEICKLIERWDMAGCQVLPIAVNLSRANFSNPDFFDAYERLVKKYNIPAGSIEFEFTESLLYENMDDLNRLVTKIHNLGFSCSIDDFGSGYSSLNMLKDVRVDVLKLDRVFFIEGDDSKRAKDVIQSVISLAKALNLKTVSEGIELQEQVDFLKEMGCDFVQGYIFAKPMTITAFERLVYFKEDSSASADVTDEPSLVF